MLRASLLFSVLLASSAGLVPARAEPLPASSGLQVADAVCGQIMGLWSGQGWGAWELVARYSDTNLNWNLGQTANAGQLAGIAGGEQKIVALGINWYPNRNIKIALQDNIVSVKKGVIGNPGRDSQDFNITGIRVQYSN